MILSFYTCLQDCPVEVKGNHQAEAYDICKEKESDKHMSDNHMSDIVATKQENNCSNPPGFWEVIYRQFRARCCCTTMPLRGFTNEGIAGSFTSSCWGYWNHYGTLHGSSFWFSNANSMAHIPIAATGSLCLC